MIILRIIISIYSLKKKKKLVKLSLTTFGKINSSEIRKILKLLKFKTNYFEDINLTLGDKKKLEGVTTNISFDINEKFKIKNVGLNVNGLIGGGKLRIKEKRIIKEFLPEFDGLIGLKDFKIIFSSTKKTNEAQLLKLEGKAKFVNSSNYEKIKILQEYQKKNRIYKIKVSSSLNGLLVHIPKLNYKKTILLEKIK